MDLTAVDKAGGEVSNPNRMFRRRLIYCEDGQVYLMRFPLLVTPWFMLMLHRFHRPDPACLHDHPWPFWSLVLWGGYWELYERADGIRGIAWRRPGSVAYRPATWKHRITTLHPRRATWTLILTGRKVRGWGFWTPAGWVPWRKYHADGVRADC